MARGTWSALLALGWMAVASTAAEAQGWIEPGVDRGGTSVERVRTDVRVRVEGRVARVEVSEWFRNDGRRLAEGDYLYPLPGEAVFEGFSLFQGETELRGEIMDAEQARRVYEEIVRRKADPALIELAGHGLLRARVFPIGPGEERKVTLRYTQRLERAGDALQLLYAGERPGGGRGHEDARTSFEVEVRDGSAFLDPFSPTHALEVRREGGALHIEVEGALDGRASIFLPLAGSAVGMSVATHRPPGEDGYFMLTLSPDRGVEAAEPRDVTAVIDVSGSMSGEKIAQARAALRQLVASLGSGDRFRLIAFSNAVRAQSEGWVRAARTGDVEAAGDWIDRLVADGGTNIEGALEEALRLESPGDRLPVVIFLTDGLPTVGEQSPERLADRAERRAGRARIFAFGVGHDVNTHLLDRLSEATRGTTDYVQPGEDVERAVSVLAGKIRHPVLTDLELVGDGARLAEVYPVRLPDLFAGEELVVFGRFRGEGAASLAVRGRRSGAPVAFATELVLPGSSEANSWVPRLWASRKLGHLERQVWTEGETESLVEEMRRLALRYGLPSRYTAYLVEEPDAVVGWDRGRLVGVAPGAAAPPAFGAEASAATGAAAVRMAEQAKARREARSAADLQRSEEAMLQSLGLGRPSERDGRAAPTEAGRRVAGGRVFVLHDGAWTDAAHREGRPVVRVRLYGRAYFDLLRALPELRAVVTGTEGSETWIVAGEETSLRLGGEGVDALPPEELAEIVRAFRGA